MDCMSRASKQRRSGSRDLSLEQAGQAAVGERLAAGLAGGAVLERGVGEGDLPDRVAADLAGLAGLAVHPQAALLLALEVGGGQARGPLDRLVQSGLDGV